MLDQYNCIVIYENAFLLEFLLDFQTLKFFILYNYNIHFLFFFEFYHPTIR